VQHQARHFLITQYVYHDGIPDKRDLIMGEGALLHDFRGAQLIAAINDV
jgi:hypothetical protein